MISVTCTCGKRLKADAKNAGRKAKCPSCGAGLIFPRGAESDDPPATTEGNPMAWMLRQEPEPEPEPEAAPPPPVYFPADEPREPEDPEPVLAYDQAVARNLGRPSPGPSPTSPGLSPSPVRRDAEPAAYVWADVLASGMGVIGAGQFFLTLLVAIIQSERAGGPQSITISEGPPPDPSASPVAMIAYSFGVAVASVLAASVARVIVDAARTLRQLRDELRAR